LNWLIRRSMKKGQKHPGGEPKDSVETKWSALRSTMRKNGSAWREQQTSRPGTGFWGQGHSSFSDVRIRAGGLN
jgi:hypothetical protein